jgi:5-methylcytosine-specific restriction endonuclease McrA
MPTFTGICFYCRQPFEATHSLANICSPDCRERTAASRTTTTKPPPDQLAAASLVDERRCARCRKVMPEGADPGTHCSVACKRAGRRNTRRQRIRQARIETVSISVLRVRDADTCRICGEPIDFTRRPPDPRAATIDHVIALSKGGAHSYANTQLAHLRCNLAKGAG